MAGYIRLQELRTVNTSGAQDLDQAVDIGDFEVLVVQVRVAAAGDDLSLLFLQHAPVLEEEAFEDLCATLRLNEVGATTRVFRDPSRWLRWRVEVTGGSPSFLIDVVGRCG